MNDQVTRLTTHVDDSYWGRDLLGWGVLPESMIDKSLVKLTVNKSKMKRELGIIYHAARTLSNPASALTDLLKQHTSG